MASKAEKELNELRKSHNEMEHATEARQKQPPNRHGSFAHLFDGISETESDHDSEDERFWESEKRYRAEQTIMLEKKLGIVKQSPKPSATTEQQKTSIDSASTKTGSDADPQQRIGAKR